MPLLDRLPAEALDPATWAARHRLMCRVLAVQAVLLAGWAVLVADTVVADLTHFALIAAAAAIVTVDGASPSVRAGAMALGLFTESALAVHLAEGAVAIHFHYFVMLCLLAQYEDPAPFALGVGYVIVQHGVMGTMHPDGVYGRGPEAEQPWLWALVHGAFIVMASAALVAGWRANARLRLSDRRSREEAERHLRDLTLLRRLAQEVASRDDARQAVVDRLHEMAHADVAFLLEPGPDGLGCTAAVGTQSEDALRAPAAAHALETGHVTWAAIGGLRLAFQPVVVDDRPAAVLAAGWEEEATVVLESRTGELLALAADEAAVALQRLIAMRELETAAMTDALTGIANRRAFDAELPRAIARARRSGEALSLALMDLNGLKALNDRHGHDAGDRLLRESAAAWAGQLRGSDLLARIGGDEFAVILPSSGPEDAAMVADRLRRALPHPAGCGVGIVAWDGTEGAADLVQRADRALYEDKARIAR
jgi:diguanylate cyclase (GGDEF)-like protein